MCKTQALITDFLSDSSDWVNFLSQWVETVNGK